jgi:hypothetical protein
MMKKTASYSFIFFMKYTLIRIKQFNNKCENVCGIKHKFMPQDSFVGYQVDDSLPAEYQSRF